VQLIWREKAVADLERIDAWLSHFEGANPAAVRRRILDAANRLERLGDIGRPNKIKGFRELSVRSAPYIIVYKRLPAAIEILAIYHTAQNR
jgi:plasmid stabilization system protein ParE